MLPLALVACGGGGSSDDREAAAASGKAVLDAPSLGFITDTFIVIVNAGPSGAPAGFSLQWMTTADYRAYGWPSGSAGPRKSFCSGSFSGVPAGSIYRLPPSGLVSVTIGPAPPEPGRDVPPSCDVALDCRQTYVFRAYAHADPASGRLRSDLGPAATAAAACNAGGVSLPATP